MRAFLRAFRAHALAFSSNWRTYEAPFPAKLWLALRNRAKAFVTLRMCCGHDGQPGC